MSHGFILLNDWQVALIVLLTRTLIGCSVIAVQQELGKMNILLTAAVAFHVVDETAKADERLLHLLMTVVPGLLRSRSDVVAPAISQFLGRVVHARVFLVRHQVMVDG